MTLVTIVVEGRLAEAISKAASQEFRTPLLQIEYLMARHYGRLPEIVEPIERATRTTPAVIQTEDVAEPVAATNKLPKFSTRPVYNYFTNLPVVTQASIVTAMIEISASRKHGAWNGTFTDLIKEIRKQQAVQFPNSDTARLWPFSPSSLGRAMAGLGRVLERRGVFVKVSETKKKIVSIKNVTPAVDIKVKDIIVKDIKSAIDPALLTINPSEIKVEHKEQRNEIPFVTGEDVWESNKAFSKRVSSGRPPVAQGAQLTLRQPSSIAKTIFKFIAQEAERKGGVIISYRTVAKKCASHRMNRNSLSKHIYGLNASEFIVSDGASILLTPKGIDMAKEFGYKIIES